MLVAVGVIWGTIGVAAELINRRSDLDPFAVNWLRSLMASPVLVLLAMRAMPGRVLRATRRDLALMAFMGLLVIIYQLLYLIAVDGIGPSAATLVSLCVPPVLVALLSIPLLGERLGRRGLLSLAGAVVGTVLLIGWRAGPRDGDYAVGVALAFGSAVGIAAHVMLSRSVAGQHHPLRPLAIGFPAGVVAFAPLALARGLPLDQSPGTWALLLYLALFPSVLGYWLYQRALRDVAASTASIVTLIEPLVTAVIAWRLFDERLGLVGWIGGGLLVLSILTLSTRQPDPDRGNEATGVIATGTPTP